MHTILCSNFVVSTAIHNTTSSFTHNINSKMRKVDTNTAHNMTSPLIHYEFPCSYLGKPKSIKSSLSSSILGPLKPPLWSNLDLEGNNSLNATHQATNYFNDPSIWLSCPRRTIDGVSSTTVLESEMDIASLQSYTIDTQDIDRNALALEIWFTHFFRNETTKDESNKSLLSIVSFSEPLVSVSESENAGNHGDPCARTQLMIGLRGGVLELIYRDYYEYLPESFFEFDDDFGNYQKDPLPRQYSCRILRLSEWKLGEENLVDEDGQKRPRALSGLHHLVVAWKNSGSNLQVFGNGKAILSIDLFSEDEGIQLNTNSDFMRHWDPAYRLQVFSDSAHWKGNLGTRLTDHNNKITSTSDDDSFPAAIHEVALFREVLNNESVRSLYEAGVEKRKDPFLTFFEDPENPFEPILLVASSKEDKSEEVIVLQSGSAAISIGASKASNSTTELWDVLVEILDLPSYGELIFNNTRQEPLAETSNYGTVQIGDKILLHENELQINLEYRHVQEDYFSVPKHSYNGTVLATADLPDESFSYRLIATKKMPNTNTSNYSNSTKFLLGSSEPVRQNLTIIHKNHPPFLVGLPREVVQPEWQPTGLGSRPWATLGSEIFLNDDKDHDISRVRLDFWAENGTLSIDLPDSEILAAAEITHCSNPMPTGLGGEWVCNGKSDKNTTLLATPTGVSKILSNLKYNALHWDTSDSIILRIYDGSGNLCPQESNHYNTTAPDECFSISAIVEVPPMPRTEGGPSAGSIWSDHRGWWISLVVFFAILSSTCCCAIACWRRLRRIKKLNDIAVSDLKRPSVVLASPEEGFPSNLAITEIDRKSAAIGLKQHNTRTKDADSAV